MHRYTANTGSLLGSRHRTGNQAEFYSQTAWYGNRYRYRESEQR